MPTHALNERNKLSEVHSQLDNLNKRITVSFSAANAARDESQRRQLLESALSSSKDAWSLQAKLPDYLREAALDVGARGSKAAHDLLQLLALPVVNGVPRALAEADEVQKNPPAPLELRQLAKERLQPLAEHGAEIKRYRHFAQDVIDGVEKRPGPLPKMMKLGLPVAHEAIRLASLLQTALASQAVIYHSWQLATHEWPDAVMEQLAPLQVLLENCIDLFNCILGKDAEAAQARTDELRKMRSMAEKVEMAADRFADAATENWSADGDGPRLWELSVEYAEVAAACASVMFDYVKNWDRGAAATAAPPTADEEARSATSAEPASAAPQEAPSGAQRARRSRRRSQRTRTNEEPSTPVAAAAPDPRAAVLEKARGLLRKGETLTLNMAAQVKGDPLAFALALAPKNDAQVIEVMVKEGQNPSSIASVTRSCVESWFGSIDTLTKARDKIASLENGPGVKGQARIAELNERIEALKRVNARIGSDEADALKLLAFPKAQHVRRLLEMGQIQGVTPPERLPSDGDEGDRGTLFEMKIQPRNLADGSGANPLFLHVHTSKQVSAEELLGLEFGRFSAIHVKTARQKNLGKQWEQMQQSMGKADAYVHRAQVKDTLWNDLKALMLSAAPAPASAPH